MTELRIPEDWLDHQEPTGRWQAWLGELPRLAAEVLADWSLHAEGDQRHGYAAMVLHVRTEDGTGAVLKIGFPHSESQHEHLALQHWHGDGAVRLLRADPGRGAMLLERLHDEDLTDLWDLEACEIVAGFYRRIHVPALPQLRTLSSYVERWDADLRRLPRGAPMPRRLVEQAIGLGAAFVSDPATDGTMIHGDLHYENVLAADREPWLVIDPKPMSGDPHYEVAPMLWNRFDELAGDIRSGVRRRFHTVVDAAELDEERARDWVVVRMVHNAMWSVMDAERVGAEIPAQEREWITQCITIAKAVQE